MRPSGWNFKCKLHVFLRAFNINFSNFCRFFPIFIMTCKHFENSFMRYFIYARGINAYGCLNLTVFHMTILHYQLLHSINIFCPKNWFWMTFTKFVGEQMAATIKPVIPAFHSVIGWGFIAKSGNKLIDAFLSWYSTSKVLINHRMKIFTS